MFIVKWREKGPIKALGLHHAAITVATVGIVELLTLWLLGSAYAAIAGASFAWGAWSCWYFFKEHRENGHKFEIFDSLSPLLFGGLTIWALIIERFS